MHPVDLLAVLLVSIHTLGCSRIRAWFGVLNDGNLEILMNIVFAHFGKTIPTHLKTNLRRSISLFPEHSVFLITDSLNLDFEIQGLGVFGYKKDESWDLINSKLKHPKEFRDGFWVKTLGRFFALDYFLELHPGPLLHVESDVLLAPDFPFKEVQLFGRNIAFPLVSENQGIASSLFLRDRNASRKLCKHAIECVMLDANATDMTILRSFASNFYSEVRILPTGFSELLVDNARDVPLEVTAYQDFKGVFDGLDFGYYLFGIDPRNNRGLLLLQKRIPNYFIDAGRAQFVYNATRQFVDVIAPNSFNSIPVYSLHIHSKRVELFRTQGIESVFFRFVKNSNRRQYSRFIIRIAMRSILEAGFRRMKRLLRLGL